MITVDKEILDNSCTFYFIFKQQKRKVLRFELKNMQDNYVDDYEEIRVCLEEFFKSFPLFFWEHYFELTFAESVVEVNKLVQEIYPADKVKNEMIIYAS